MRRTPQKAGARAARVLSDAALLYVPQASQKSEIGAKNSINKSCMTANRYFCTHVHSALLAELTLVHTGGNTAAFQLSVHRSCAHSNEVMGSRSSDRQALRLLSQANSQISRISEELSPCLQRVC